MSLEDFLQIAKPWTKYIIRFWTMDFNNSVVIAYTDTSFKDLKKKARELLSCDKLQFERPIVRDEVNYYML